MSTDPRPADPAVRPTAEGDAPATWSNLDYPHMAEGWAFPTPEGREHYFRKGRSFCGRHHIEPGARIAGRMDEADDPCVTCGRVITAEMRRLWCEHGDPRAECPDCAESSVTPPVVTPGDPDPAVVKELADLRERLARVEALADEWDRTVYKLPPGYPMTVNGFCRHWFKDALRAALNPEAGV